MSYDSSEYGINIHQFGVDGQVAMSCHCGFCTGVLIQRLITELRRTVGLVDAEMI
uniref:Uncharacterized protein n=1 Tax=Kalanchoe fedtschenkoi TaxID=63787 RepID=A0A7N0VI53_KALFE